MSKVPYMPFFGNDFFGSSRVKLMSSEEKVAYLTLLWFQWVDDGLPVAVDALRCLAEDVTDEVLDCFPVARDGKRRNPALEHHRRRSKTMSSAQSKRAKSRWDIRKDDMPDECPDDAQNMPSVSVSVSVPEVSSEGRPSGEADRKTDLGTLMGAIRKTGYRKATTRRDEMRDYSVAKAMLASHPVETCLDAIEGTRKLVGESEHFTLRLVWAEGKDGGPPMFTRALDAVAKPASWETRERTGPSDVGSILKTMGAA